MPKLSNYYCFTIHNETSTRRWNSRLVSAYFIPMRMSTDQYSLGSLRVAIKWGRVGHHCCGFFSEGCLGPSTDSNLWKNAKPTRGNIFRSVFGTGENNCLQITRQLGILDDEVSTKRFVQSWWWNNCVRAKRTYKLSQKFNAQRDIGISTTNNCNSTFFKTNYNLLIGKVCGSGFADPQKINKKKKTLPLVWFCW